MKQNSIENQQQDVIIQEPELVMTALNDGQIALLNNPRYLNLIKILYQKGPMTIAEMAEEKDLYVDMLDFGEDSVLILISENYTSEDKYIFEFLNRY